jgi:hypothetical protein
MVSDIKNFDFYIKDDIGISPMKNNIITIFKSNYEGFYKVEVDYVLYERYQKIYRITKSDILKKIFDLIILCEKNMISYNSVEIELVDELSKSIDKDIIKNLRELK